MKRNEGQKFNLTREETFSAKLKTLFDIAHADILETVDEVRKEFYLNQKKPERVGYICNIETLFDIQERAQKEKEEKILLRLQKSENEKAKLSKFQLIVNSISNDRKNVSFITFKSIKNNFNYFFFP